MREWLNAYDERLQKNTTPTSQRHKQMLQVNPKYVLKNYILQEAIDKAEDGDYSLVDELLEIVKKPYDEHEKYERYAQATPNEFKNIKLSCSS